MTWADIIFLAAATILVCVALVAISLAIGGDARDRRAP